VRKDFEQRFWDRVANGAGCWEWTAGKDGFGYGKVRVPGKKWMDSAHRVAYELTNGPIETGLCVCHSCDNPACCRPSHLFLGTIADNNTDMVAKGRNYSHPNGLMSKERNPNRKIDMNTARTIREEYATTSQERLAETYGLSQTTISRIVRGVYWKED
jgi:HNH endonuclease